MPLYGVGRGPCHILREQPTWNEFLCRACMGLKEERAGQLTLSSSCRSPVQPSQPDETHCAATLAFRRVKKHRGADAFDGNACFGAEKHGKVVFSGLEPSTVNKLTIPEDFCSDMRTVFFTANLSCGYRVKKVQDTLTHHRTSANLLPFMCYIRQNKSVQCKRR